MSKSSYSSHVRDPRYVSDPSRSYHQSSQHLTSGSQRSSSRQERSSSRSQYSTSNTRLQSSRLECSTSDSDHQQSRRSSSRDHRETSPYSSFNPQDMINNQHQEEYHSFHVPSSLYELIFINDNTSNNTLDKLLNHVSLCRQYSIDTESERDDNKLALIQINSIPINPPTIVILCELTQLPDHDSHKYKKICELFRLIFRSENEIYSWGDMRLELQQERNLLTWPIPAKLINIQPHFNRWYTWALTQCRVKCLNEDEEINEAGIKQQQQPCTCHSPSPYRLNELWSLQKALMFAGKLFIDKSCQRSHWAAGLSSHRSSLSSGKQQRMINYAVHDVIAVTYLIRPITENWTFERIRRRRMDEIFIGFESTELPSLPSSITKKKIKKNINLYNLFNSTEDELEQISDEEIQLCRLIEPNDRKNGQYDIINDEEPMEQTQQQQVPEQEDNGLEQISDDEIIINPASVNNHRVVVDDQNYQDDIEKPRKHRSAQARKKKNLKRNTKHKLNRYRNAVRRCVYHRFNNPMIKLILKQYGIKFVHVKINEENSELVIGLKTRHLRDETEHRLPMNVFNERSYYYYRQKYHRRSN
jgi:hypothetical protein